MGAEAEVREAERKFDAAIVAKDLPALEALLAPEYRLVGIRSTGVSDMPRPAWFAALSRMSFDHLTAEVRSVEVFGDIALAAVEGDWALDFDGRGIDERFYLTDVWVRRDGRWRIVRRHSSPYPHPALAAS
jgi:ketosteroid isomerase-like protein